MTNQTKDNKTRKPYRKPKVEQVRLIAEEAVLGACRDVGSGDAGDISCNNPEHCVY